jgi:two-component system chemotaxis response regulator CheY
MKVLLIDDSRTMRAIQRKILAGLGYSEVAEANDGVEGLSQVVAEKPELILVDWNMPNMDGLTFVRKLRETRKDIPIIMVTTEAERGRVIEAIRAGVNNYVVKPFTPQMLTEKIQQTLQTVGAAT